MTITELNDIATVPYHTRLKRYYNGETPTNLIVLFTAPKTGVVLSGDETYCQGYYLDNWNEAAFKNYDGVITIKNC